MDDTLSTQDGHQPTAAAGTRLREARERAGLSLADVAARTRVQQRYLAAIEAGRYDDLPSPTYASGFAKAYARTVGADEVAVAAAVRDEMARRGAPAREYVPYELPDPARVPSRGVAIVGLGVALAVLVLVGLWYGTDLFRGGTVSTPVPAASVAAAPAGAPPIGAAPAQPLTAAVPPATGGQVRLAAGKSDVWLRVYDAAGKTLFLGTLKPGEHFDVPADANDPMVNVGRPDQLAVTLDGRPVPPLGKGDHAIKDVRVSGAALATRLAAGSEPAAAPSPSATHAESDRHERHGDERAERHHRALTDTQRANLDSAAAVSPATTGNGAP